MIDNWKAGAGRAIALVTISLCAACESGTKIDEKTLALEAERVEAFNNELADSTAAINAGDLHEARDRLEIASELAANETERDKIETLDQFLVGAEALLIGDFQLASIEWSRIDDPALGQEIREKAHTIGMTVPEAPEASEGKNKK